MPLNPITDSKVATGESYDPEREVLTLEFKNGFHYEYQNVTPEKYADFSAAESKGGWIGANLTGKNAKAHPFTKITPPPEEEDA